MVSNPVFSRRRGKGLIRSDVVEDLKFVKKLTGFLFPFPIHCRFFFLKIFLACANSQTLGDIAEPILVLEFEIPQKIPSLSHKF